MVSAAVTLGRNYGISLRVDRYYVVVAALQALAKENAHSRKQGYRGDKKI